MSFLKNLFKVAAAIAAIGVAAAAILEILDRRKARQEEMDEYILGDDESACAAGPADEEYLDQDFQEWSSLDEKAVVEVSFLTKKDDAAKFQEALAHAGCSSNYDDQTSILDIIIAGPKDREDLEGIENALKEAMKETDSTYLGFAFQ